MNHLTPTEQRFMDVLADGKPHRLHELTAVIADDLATDNATHQHIYNLRRKLKQPREISCIIFRRSSAYRLMDNIFPSAASE